MIGKLGSKRETERNLASVIPTCFSSLAQLVQCEAMAEIRLCKQAPPSCIVGLVDSVQTRVLLEALSSVSDVVHSSEGNDGHRCGCLGNEKGGHVTTCIMSRTRLATDVSQEITSSAASYTYQPRHYR